MQAWKSCDGQYIFKATAEEWDRILADMEDAQATHTLYRQTQQMIDHMESLGIEVA